MSQTGSSSHKSTSSASSTFSTPRGYDSVETTRQWRQKLLDVRQGKAVYKHSLREREEVGVKGARYDAFRGGEGEG